MFRGKCIEKRANARKEVFALCEIFGKGFEVLKLCENYDGKVQGGIRKTWRVVKAGMTEIEAKTLLERKLKCK